MPIPSYSTGTVSIGAGETVIAGNGTIWSGVNARAGDDIVVAGHTVIIEDVIDPTHLAIDAWPYAAVPAGAAYKIVQRSPLRFAGGQAMADVSTLIAALNTERLLSSSWGLAHRAGSVARRENQLRCSHRPSSSG